MRTSNWWPITAAAMIAASCAAPRPSPPSAGAAPVSETGRRTGSAAPSFVEEERVVDLGDGRRRAGTRVVPAGPGPHPAVLLVGTPGEGRDGVVRGLATRRLLAAALAEAGLASLRLDDADVGADGTAFERTTFERLEDARRALAWLGREPDVDAERLALVGHGEGALVAIWAAVFADEIAAAAWLAPTTSSVEAALHARLDRESPDVAAEDHARLDRLFEAVREGEGVDAAARAAPFADEFAPIAESPWFRVWIGLDPTPLLGRARVPTLVVLAEEDRRFPADLHGPALARALDRAGRPDVVVTTIEGADHAFLAAGDRDGTVGFAPGFLDTLVGWLALL